MTQTRRELVDKISRLPVEKLNAAMIFINFLEQEKEIKISAENAPQDFGKAKRPFSELRGIFKGKIRMSEDFDEPLEEMKEYME